MNTCKTCRFWKPPDNTKAHLEPINVGECLCPKIAFGCANYGDDEVVTMSFIKYRVEGSKLVESDEAAVCDGSGYKASFHPGPDFGCIHWQLSQNLVIASITPGQNHLSLIAQEPME